MKGHFVVRSLSALCLVVGSSLALPAASFAGSIGFSMDNLLKVDVVGPLLVALICITGGFVFLIVLAKAGGLLAKARVPAALGLFLAGILLVGVATNPDSATKQSSKISEKLLKGEIGSDLTGSSSEGSEGRR